MTQSCLSNKAGSNARFKMVRDCRPGRGDSTQLVERAKKGDANNRLYQVEASMDYDPSSDLDKIKARLLAINFEDDELNPPQLGTVEPAIEQIPGAQYVLIPASKETNSHYSTLLAHLWAPPLSTFMAEAATN